MASPATPTYQGVEAPAPTGVSEEESILSDLSDSEKDEIDHEEPAWLAAQRLPLWSVWATGHEVKVHCSQIDSHPFTGQAFAHWTRPRLYAMGGSLLLCIVGALVPLYYLGNLIEVFGAYLFILSVTSLPLEFLDDDAHRINVPRWRLRKRFICNGIVNGICSFWMMVYGAHHTLSPDFAPAVIGFIVLVFSHLLVFPFFYALWLTRRVSSPEGQFEDAVTRARYRKVNHWFPNLLLDWVFTTELEVNGQRMMAPARSDLGKILSVVAPFTVIYFIVSWILVTSEWDQGQVLGGLCGLYLMILWMFVVGSSLWIRKYFGSELVNMAIPPRPPSSVHATASGSLSGESTVSSRSRPSDETPISWSANPDPHLVSRLASFTPTQPPRSPRLTNRHEHQSVSDSWKKALPPLAITPWVLVVVLVILGFTGV